jgi:hypothetical protein
MQLIANPIFIYVFVVAGFLGLLFLHFAALQQLEAVRRRMADEKGISRVEFEHLRAQLMEDLGAREARDAPPPPATVLHLNLSRRGQALRMARRGDSPDRIASALGIPKREVDLLLKVQRSVAGAA